MAQNAKVEITRYHGGKIRVLDHDNLIASYKPVIDCLRGMTPSEKARALKAPNKMIRLGIFVDDTPEHLEVIYRQEKDPARAGHTAVTVTAW